MSLDQATVAALIEALEDEYKARATYAAVIEKFGLVRPFANIIRAEDRHAAALERIFSDHAMPLPEDRWLGNITAPDSLEAACEAGVTGEIENKAMYDRLMAATSDERVWRVFDNLRRASQENHLPAFQRALARSSDDISEFGYGKGCTGSAKRSNRHDGAQIGEHQLGRSTGQSRAHRGHGGRHMARL